MPDPAAGNTTGPDEARPVTMLLKAVEDHEPGAADRLMSAVYDELRMLAHARMNNERTGHTLQTTALVNEAYVRLIGKDDARFAGSGHFFRAAAEAMRKILIDHARARNAAKRGGGEGGRAARSALEIGGLADAAAAEDPAGFLALDEAIVRLNSVDPQAAEIVRLKFYAGAGDEGVASAMGISARTVRRDWAFARGWLRDALEQDVG